MAKHIVKSFDAQLEQLDRKIGNIGADACSLLENAVECLRTGWAQNWRRVVDSDRRSTIADEVERLGLCLLALRQPMGEDLRCILGALKVVGELDQVRHVAYTVARRAASIASEQSLPLVDGVVHLGLLVQMRLRAVVDAYGTRDPAAALEIWSSDQAIDQVHTTLFRELLAAMVDEPRRVRSCAQLLFIAKALERAGDHATNVAEQVFFVVRGTMPAYERRKEDCSSITEVSPLPVSRRSGARPAAA